MKNAVNVKQFTPEITLNVTSHQNFETFNANTF